MLKKILLIFSIFPIIFALELIPLGKNDEQGEVEIFLVSNEVHFDLLLPMDHELQKWSEFFSLSDFKAPKGEWLELGWGDREFYQEVPTWNEFRLSVAMDALFVPGPAAMHVRLVQGRPEEYFSYRRIKVSKETYRKLVKEVKEWFVQKNERPVLLAPGYGPDDNFYQAHGSFSLLFTCNIWVAHVLKEAGLKYPLWSPTKYGLELIY